MSDTTDRWKSLVRHAVRRATDEVTKIPGVAQAKGALRELRNLGAVVPTELVRAELLRTPSLQSLSMSISDSGVHIEASFDDADDITVRVVPGQVRFAARGAKEVSFEVHPVEVARHRHAQDLVVAIASAVARALWAAVLRGDNNSTPMAIVDRDAENVFRIDLRTLSILKKARGGAAVSVMLDALALESIRATEGALRLKVTTPILF
ncbi:MAG: hypothetical protein IPK60_05855 [Sandaracinaceae bacterium]|nr:hypothetical protein [Sandaracinaceae bacterium]